MRSFKITLTAMAVGVLTACVFDSVGPGDKPQNSTQAHRFLTQATFGADQANIDRLTELGYDAWIDEQFAQTPAFTYQAFFAQRNAALKADQPNNAAAKAGPEQVLEAFYTRALTDPAQLRARLAFALSEIFVVSFGNEILGGQAPEMVAGYMDTLDAGLNGTYRELLERVSKSPAMGEYLTFRSNYKEDPSIGRHPDENYAREVMQLFSIGVYELNPDGSLKLNAQGKPIETYTPDDVRGLAKVFTGWSNYRSGSYASLPAADCFAWALTCRDPAGFYQPMVPYPDYHSTSEKRFLGVTLPEQSTPDPQGDLTAALDRLASHPNTAPFFSRQLIQRLVTSNPKPDYIARVAQRFTDTGGNLKETVKAILMDKEARSDISLFAPDVLKQREPVLRLTAILRAFRFNTPTQSVSSGVTDAPSSQRVPFISIGGTSDPAVSLGQTPLFAPSVFNFFRPGYAPPQGSTAAQGMVAPELQLVSETSITGYVNFTRDLLSSGVGPSWVVDMDGQCGAFTPALQQYIQGLNPAIAANKTLQTAAANCKVESITQRGVTLSFVDQRTIAGDTNALINHVSEKLVGGSISTELRQTLSDALLTMPVPTLASDGSNLDAVNSALDQRTRAAILILAVSPDFLFTK